MNFVEFLDKNKKIILMIVIIAAAVIIGVFLTRAGGGIAGIIGLLWGMATGKKSERIEQHEEAIKRLDDQLTEIKNKQETVKEELQAGEQKEEEIRKEIEETKKKYSEMSISDIVKEHNKSLGY